MAHDESANDRIAAIKLLNNLAVNFGRELCEGFVASELMFMADDADQKVRKITVQNFVKVCETVSTESFTKKLLPVYEKLAKDKNWPVREAAVKIIYKIATVCPQETRETLLVSLYKDFYNDPSQFVKRTATLQVGSLIFSLKGSKIDTFLIQLYTSLVPKKGMDEDLAYHCAYTFPAVLYALGKDIWSTLRETYKTMVAKDVVSIKQTLAASIHEVAKIVGPKVATEDLDGILKGFLDSENTVQYCFAHLHEFLRELAEEQRLAYLELIGRIVQKSRYNWRLREIFALNAEAYAKLYSVQLVYEKILPIAFKLLEDEVIQVREKMCAPMYQIVMMLKSEPKLFEETMSRIDRLCTSRSFRDRQTFLHICSGFMCNEAVFEQHLLTGFLALQKDRVPNVRAALAMILSHHMKCSGLLAKNTYIVRTLEMLQGDAAGEVRRSVAEALAECDKMKEIEEEKEAGEDSKQREAEELKMREMEEVKMKEMEKVKAEVEKKIDISGVDEEEVEELNRRKAEQYFSKGVIVDEIVEVSGKQTEQ